MIRVEIDGRVVHLPEGTRLLHALRELGIAIPTLCHWEHVPHGGRCGICLVEEVGRGLVHACQTTVTPGACYRSTTSELQTARHWAMRLLLRNHPLRCAICPVEGRCRLQTLAMELGFQLLANPQPTVEIIDTRHPFIHRQPSLCIQCGLCVSVCQKVQGADVLGMMGRGEKQAVIAGADTSLEQAGCVACGGCLAVCPTGAIREPSVLARQVGERVVATTCGYCAVGCRLQVTTEQGRIVRVEPDPAGSANQGHACVKGRFGHGFVHSPDRLTRPMIRNAQGVLEACDWQTALGRIAEGFATIRDTHGPESLGVVSSARCTNEENYVLQKFARVVLGTNNIDNCARVCHSPSAFALGEALGTGAGTSGFEEIDRSDLLLIVGANPTESHPVLGARIRRAVRNGCTLIVLDPRRTELARMAHLHLPLRPGSNVAVINAMQRVILDEKRLDAAFVADHSEGLESLMPVLASCTPEWAAQVGEIPAELIFRAARLFAQAQRGQILWGLGITEACQGTMAAFGLINLAILTGNIGRPGTGASPIRGQNNVQGACDMGALPNVTTDYQSVTNPEMRARFKAVWGVEPPAKPGMKMPEMFAAARAGTLRGLYLVAQDPAQSDPDSAQVAAALRKLEFLVVQEIFLSESARFAHVVLPGASFFEKRGTFVNSDRRVQPVLQAVSPPGQARTDGDIVLALAKRMGWDLGCADASEEGLDADRTLAEIAQLTPNWGGISTGRLHKLGFLQWPCPDADHPGTGLMHGGGDCLRGLARLTPTPWQPPESGCDPTFPLLLTTGRTLYHYNVGTMTRRSAILSLVAAQQESIRIHPHNAAELGIRSGDTVAIVSRQGETTAQAEVVAETPPGVVFMAFHFPQTRTNLLVGPGSDTHTRCPEYKVTPVRIQKIPLSPRPAGRE
ncbi:MAG: formate dehydrogenase subunit alpha [Magnetococcales bacterium]|nr:formate dehydrogenase subunit alpha [Magnetococcales bacterium]